MEETAAVDKQGQGWYNGNAMIRPLVRQRSSLAQMQPLLAEMIAPLQQQFGDDLVAVALDGSYARDTADTGSDLDLLVVVEHLPYEWKEIHALEDELMDWGGKIGQGFFARQMQTMSELMRERGIRRRRPGVWEVPEHAAAR